MTVLTILTSDRRGRPAVLDTLDKVQLPQGAVRLERPVDQPGHQVRELTHPTGGGQRRAADVKTQVELRIIHPHGPREPERHLPDPLPEPRRIRQAGVDELHHPVDVPGLVA